MSELEANQESIQIPADQSATDFLKDQVAKVEGKTPESTPEPEPKPDEPTPAPETEPETPPEPSPDEPDEPKPEVEPKGDILDEPEMLKSFGFSEKSIEEMRTNYVNAQNRNKTFNWAVKNIPGFLDFIKGNFERSQKGMDIAPVSELGKKEPKEADADLSKQLEAMSIINPDTDEPMTLAEKQDYIGRLQKLMEAAGFARKDDISTAFTANQESNAEKEAIKEFQSVVKNFGESIKDDLKALKKSWVNKDDEDELGNPRQSGVSFELMNIIENELGITDPSRVSQKLLDRVWKTYLLESIGGLEMIQTNAKKSAEDMHRRKIKIRLTPKSTTEKTKAPGSMVAWANEPTTTPAMIKKAMVEMEGKARR